MREPHDRFQATVMPYEGLRTVQGASARHALPMPRKLRQALQRQALELEKQGFEVFSIHASLVMFVNASIRLTT